MSNNFTGITFAEQKVTPSDDAIIRRAMLSDGILTGCAMSYSGSTLTLGAGYLLICGRQIRHPAAQNWAVVDATSGYARLLLTVDLTRTATKEAFDQVVDTIEYASAEDGFPELEQADINGSGARYQVEICKVSLGTGGISGIVSQLQPCEASGGGVNFKLVGGLTQPTDPKENTIWVPTALKIAGYSFTVAPPEDAAQGEVWIRIGSSSPVSFSVAQKNPIMVYPVAAKQFVDGVWVDVEAYTYQNGAWIAWTVYFYRPGDECVWLTGGYNNGGAKHTILESTEEYLKISCGYADTSAAFVSGNTVDVTDLSTIWFLVAESNLETNKSSKPPRVGLHTSPTLAPEDTMAAFVKVTSSEEPTLYAVDVSKLTGSYYLAGGGYRSGATARGMTITEIYGR